MPSRTDLSGFTIEMATGMGFPMGVGIPWEWELMKQLGNGNGKEWEITCVGMGMTLIPMGFPSAYVIVIYSLLYNSNSL